MYIVRTVLQATRRLCNSARRAESDCESFGSRRSGSEATAACSTLSFRAALTHPHPPSSVQMLRQLFTRRAHRTLASPLLRQRVRALHTDPDVLTELESRGLVSQVSRCARRLCTRRPRLLKLMKAQRACGARLSSRRSCTPASTRPRSTCTSATCCPCCASFISSCADTGSSHSSVLRLDAVCW